MTVKYSGRCVGGPLDGRMYEHDWYSFRYFYNDNAPSVRDFDPNENPYNDLATCSVGVYIWDRDKGVWTWAP